MQNIIHLASDKEDLYLHPSVFLDKWTESLFSNLSFVNTFSTMKVYK